MELDILKQAIADSITIESVSEFRKGAENSKIKYFCDLKFAGFVFRDYRVGLSTANKGMFHAWPNSTVKFDPLTQKRVVDPQTGRPIYNTDVSEDPIYKAKIDLVVNEKLKKDGLFDLTPPASNGTRILSTDELALKLDPNAELHGQISDALNNPKAAAIEIKGEIYVIETDADGKRCVEIKDMRYILETADANGDEDQVAVSQGHVVVLIADSDGNVKATLTDKKYKKLEEAITE
jgi:hypothetical protein